jgi:CheY-like chemotaxis protein
MPSSRTLLVVEDNPDHALLVRMAAERVGTDVDVRVVSDGEEAVAYLSGRPPYEDRAAHPVPGLVILDLLLPGLGGFDVLEWVSSRDELADIPLVVLSSSVSPADKERSLALGARSFHSKPPDVAELGETVAAILRRWLT